MLRLLGSLLLLLQSHTANAIYKEDAGVLDFSIATAGHGAFEWAAYANSKGDDQTRLLLTTDVPSASSPSTSCFVAARSMDDGSLVWRRNVCSVPDPDHQAHAAAVQGDALYTVDNSGVVRSWTTDGGDLLWDAKIPLQGGGAYAPSIFAADCPGDSPCVAVSGGSQLVLLDASSGATLDTILANPKEGQHVEWFSVLSSSATTLQVSFALVDSSSGRIANGSSDFYTGTYEMDGAFKASAGKLKAKDILSDSVRVLGADQIWAVTASGSVVHSASGTSVGQDWMESWSAVTRVEGGTLEDPSIVRLSGTGTSGSDATMEAFRYDGSSWKPLSQGGTNSAVAVAPKVGLVVTTPAGQPVQVLDYPSGKPLETVGDVFGADGDSVSVLSVTEAADTATILMGTERGSTTLFSVTKAGGNKASLKVHWTAEEGLANLSSAIILDASHLGSDDLVEETDELSYRLSLAGRLKAQWKEVGAMLSTGGGGGLSSRDHLFGFLKVSALLSSKTHKMWGMSTAGADRGSIRWSLDLPKTALWHSMVHGTTNAAKAAHGIHGDTHSREILVLSASPHQIDWMCIDGTSGAVHAQDSVAVEASAIQQVLPVYGTSSGGCRQASLLLGDDLSLTVVPNDAPTQGLIQNQLTNTPNGLYAHTIDRGTSKLETYQVSSQEGGFLARPVGLASFDGEEIVKVAYPMRHEGMQSMSTILGDNSLLLKYINPHMAVVVTMLTDEDEQSATAVATALQKEGDGKKRKPLGAGAPGSSTQAPQGSELPNMFVNLVDTVSGRVLYRHSHANADSGKQVSVVISENWVVYTYVSAKTRRTEIGVLSLHEGMIEPKGLTYFARPEQSSTFSSFDSRDSKPVVLSKVYAYPKTITALGVTSTRQGIGRQNILLASADGSLTTLNKMILETRRPVGEVKKEEKKEGLVAYKELIPDSPLFSLNYNQTMEPFSSIVSSTTALESQSLVFGFGGPDLFFTRTSPTKGFDLLPETFNKMLVGATTVGIVVALLVVQRMGSKKALKQGWS